VDAVAESASSAKSEAELAAEAMSALGFATQEEEAASRAAADALDALAGNVGQVASASKEAASGIGGLSAKFGNLGIVAKAAIGGFAGLAALRGAEEIGRAISGSLRTAVNEFIEAERASVALAQALGSMQQFSASAMTAIRNYANEVQRTTIFEDDAVISAAALIAQVGQLSGPKLLQATQAAVELSAVLGRDLNQAALLVARGAAGATEGFSRFGVVVKGAGTDAEKFDQVLNKIGQNMQGRAAADAQTFGGAIAQLRNEWRNFLEVVGGSVAEFEPVLRKLTEMLRRAQELAALKTGFKIEGAQDLEGFIKLFDQAVAARDKFTGDPSKFDIRAQTLSGFKQAIDEMEKSRVTVLLQVKEAVRTGTPEEVGRTAQLIAQLRVDAERAGNAQLKALVHDLEFVLAAGKQAKIELQGGDKVIQGLQQITSLVTRLQSLGGAKDIQILDTASLLKGATDVGQVANQVESAADAIVDSMDKVSTAGGKVDGSALVQGFQAIEDARQSIVEKFGKLAPELEAAFSDAQDKLRARARSLDIQIDLNLVGGFGQTALDALVSGFDQAEAEIEQFKNFVRSANAAAGADTAELIQTESLLAQVKNLQDVLPLVEAAMARLRQAVALRAVVGGPEAAEGIAPLFAAALQGSAALEKQFGSMSVEAQKANKDILDGLRQIAILYPALQGPVDEFAKKNQEAATAIGDAFGSALGTLISNAEDSSKVILRIFTELVVGVIKELNKINAFKFLGSFAGPLGGILGGILGSILKADIPPIEIPVSPIPTPVIPPPEIPKVTLPPVEIPVEALPPTIPAPVLPDVEPLVIAVSLSMPDVPAVEISAAFGAVAPIVLPDIEAVEIPVSVQPTPAVEPPALPEIAPLIVGVSVELPDIAAINIPASVDIAAPELPTIEPIEIPVVVGSVPAIDVPEVEAIQVAVTVQDVQDIVTPEVDAIRIPVEMDSIPAVEAPAVDAVRIAVEIGDDPAIETPEVAAVEIAVQVEDIPAIQLPDVEAIQVQVEMGRVPEVEVPEVDAVRIPVAVDSVPAIDAPELDAVTIAVETQEVPDIERPEVDAVRIPVLLDAIPAIEVPEVGAVQIAVEAPTVPEIVAPAVDPARISVEVEMGAIPAVEVPELDAARLAVEVDAVPNIETPEVEAVRIAVEMEAIPEIQTPEVDPVQIAIEVDDVPEIATPTVDAVQIQVAMDQIPAVEVPEADAVTIAVELQKVPTVELDDVEIEAFVKAPEIPRLDAIEIPVEFLRRDVPTFDFPSVSVPVEFERPEFPRLESVPASLEFARRQAAPREDTVPASLEFARLIQQQATEETRLRRERLRVVERQPAEPAGPQITINATDGISVRRQLTAGALRREIERNFRRSGM